MGLPSLYSPNSWIGVLALRLLRYPGVLQLCKPIKSFRLQMLSFTHTNPSRFRSFPKSYFKLKIRTRSMPLDKEWGMTYSTLLKRPRNF